MIPNGKCKPIDEDRQRFQGTSELHKSKVHYGWKESSIQCKDNSNDCEKYKQGGFVKK